MNFGKTFVVLFLHTHVSVYGQTVQNAKDLRTKLMTTDGYDITVRPIADQSDFVRVNVSLALLALNSLDDVAGVLTTTAYMKVLWTDSELQWTPATYGNLASTFFPQDNIWKPDIALKNSNKDYTTLGIPSLNVEVSNDGTIEWYPFEIFTSTCSVDITYFPFDVQICHLKFVAWSYGPDEVYLKDGGGVDFSNYEESPSWDILDNSVAEEQIGEDIALSFTIKMKRKSLYAMLSVVLPILLLSVLKLFVFVLPADKSSYSVTVFLAFAIFLTIVEATMPNNSLSVAVFSIYVILMTAQSTVVTIIAVFEERALTFDEDEIKIPKWLFSLSNLGGN
ncbi:neuronal acetylcholine receptor subunit alpha-7-like [Ruditapes philippinarum]|uniref:neuronal acetylcholine receptor subunit alpha-7-like n=1 Tax=Ruditapes philippinarum TaxID=129788 RepID=UPI00295A8626|nr:neuronal acetylcholine receptor subunit alpha-7-like [Ruditapes philippinarum]